MNKQFQSFLRRKDKEVQEYNTCYHDADHWCQNCIAKPALTRVELPDGTITEGYVWSNATTK